MPPAGRSTALVPPLAGQPPAPERKTHHHQYASWDLLPFANLCALSHAVRPRGSQLSETWRTAISPRSPSEGCRSLVCLKLYASGRPETRCVWNGCSDDGAENMRPCPPRHPASLPGYMIGHIMQPRNIISSCSRSSRAAHPCPWARSWPLDRWPADPLLPPPLTCMRRNRSRSIKHHDDPRRRCSDSVGTGGRRQRRRRPGPTPPPVSRIWQDRGMGGGADTPGEC